MIEIETLSEGSVPDGENAQNPDLSIGDGAVAQNRREGDKGEMTVTGARIGVVRHRRLVG